LQLYSVSNVTQGTDALGEVNVRLESDGRIVNGQGADTDRFIWSSGFRGEGKLKQANNNAFV
jgi:2-isopropylmalate synthase